MPTSPQCGWTIRIMVQLLCLMAAMPAYAGQIAVLEGKVPAIGIGGKIEAGDEITFHELANLKPNALVVLTSPGGLVEPALTIGLEIRARGLQTLVPAGTSCASACSLIWLAGTKRMLGARAQVGFHAVSISRDGKVRVETHAFDPKLMHYLLALGYTGDATATIVNTPSAGIRWLDRIELNSNGFAAESYP